MAAAESDPYLALKFRLAAKARVLKKTGFFVESLFELENLDNEIIKALENCSKDCKEFIKYTKLRVRLLREKMSILATTKDYAGAFEAYE